MDTATATVRRTIGRKAIGMQTSDTGMTSNEHGDAPAGRATRVAAPPAIDMLGDLAHAVANSLNTVVTASQLAGLQMGDGRLDKAKASLDCVERECLRVARLMRDGRAFAGYRLAEAPTDVDMAELLVRCAGAFADRGSVRVEAAPDVRRVVGDPEALRRLFVELLDNAFEFGAHRVEVTLAADDSGRVIHVDVQDDGTGIAAAPARIFTPFFSTRPEEHSGLGLALAARIATGHGGSIAVAPSAHGGRFRVTLPAAAAG